MAILVVHMTTNCIVITRFEIMYTYTASDSEVKKASPEVSERFRCAVAIASGQNHAGNPQPSPVMCKSWFETQVLPSAAKVAPLAEVWDQNSPKVVLLPELLTVGNELLSSLTEPECRCLQNSIVLFNNVVGLVLIAKAQKVIPLRHPMFGGFCQHDRGTSTSSKVDTPNISQRRKYL